MKAIIKLQWKLHGKINERNLIRGKFLKQLEEIDKVQQKEIIHVIKEMAKRADIIYIDMDGNTKKTVKKIIVKYEENREYTENTSEIDLINQDEMYNLFKDFFVTE